MPDDEKADPAQYVAILRRLPAMEALHLDADVAPFAELITSGGLPNLKCVRACLGVFMFIPCYH